MLAACAAARAPLRIRTTAQPDDEPPMHRTTIDPVDISEAIELYLTHRQQELSQNTLRSHRYRLSHLRRWANENGLTTTDDLTGKKLMQYRTWRQQDGDLNTVTLHTQMTTVRVWVKFLESIDAVANNLHESVDVPRMDGTVRRETVLPVEQAEAIDDYLSNYQYASTDHILWTILYGVGVRLGGAHSVDVDDIDFSEGRVWFRHRPDEGTTLKNGTEGERPVTLSERLIQVLDDYVSEVRSDVTDDHGRRPLLTTASGRPSKSTLRRWIYRWTQPCQIGLDCPHDTTEAACDVAGYTDSPSGCPSVVSPHAIRRRVIIDYRKDEIPDKYISDRCNVSQQIMDNVYDVRDPETKQEDRANYFS